MKINNTFMLEVWGYRENIFHTLLHQTNSPLQAETATFNTLTKAWKNQEQYDPSKATIKTWLFRIARNALIDLQRKAKHRNHENIDDDGFDEDKIDIQPPPNALTLMQGSELHNSLMTAISNLPEEQRECVELTLLERTHPEIAKELEIPLGTVKSRMRLAFAKLGDTLKGLHGENIDESILSAVSTVIENDEENDNALKI